MEIGYFTMPSHPPECGLKEGNDWDLQILRWLDELGYQEAWIGEHHTAPWEPNPTPDLLIAQALLQTKNIRIGPGGFLLPYHHPAELANRVAMLDHLSERPAQFRCRGERPAERLGDVQCRRHVRAKPRHDARSAGDHPEALERARALHLQGQVLDGDQAGHDVRLPQTPHQAVAGSASADRRRRAFEELRHAEACRRARLHPDEPQSQSSLCRQPLGLGRGRRGQDRTQAEPQDWRLVREVFVADTDEEAWKLSTGDMMGRMMGEYFLPLLGHFGFKDYLKHAPDVPDSDVTVEYCARRNWIVGSPATVAEKIEKIYQEVGGFGVLLVFGFDYKHKPEAWRHSLELLRNEVMPRLKHLGADRIKAA